MTRFMDQGDEDEVRREVGLGGGSGISISGGGNTGDSEFAFQPYGGNSFWFILCYFLINFS